MQEIATAPISVKLHPVEKDENFTIYSRVVESPLIFMEIEHIAARDPE